MWHGDGDIRGEFLFISKLKFFKMPIELIVWMFNGLIIDQVVAIKCEDGI